MNAKEFVDNKLGDGKYTHSPITMYRSEIEEWLLEYAEQQAKNLSLSDVSKRSEMLEIFYKRMVGRTEMHDSDEYFMDEIMKIFQ